tara:strand:- start:511 stop:1200 length:690 start_codon:yes stop_codon:yes gene_type:complete
MGNNLEEFISLSDKKAKKQNKEYYLYNSILVFMKDPFPVDIDVDAVLKRVEAKIPSSMVTRTLDAVYIGSFPSLLDSGDYTAKYEDGAIYISNEQYDEQDLFRDLVHEISHAIEDLYGQEIFADRTVENEFLGKRQRLYSILSSEGYEVSLSAFMNVEHSDSMDNFLYRELGYPTLTSYAMGLFVSPYAVTSLGEYYARGFEEYVYGEKEYLKKVSPSLYNKIEKLLGG